MLSSFPFLLVLDRRRPSRGDEAASTAEAERHPCPET
jgi:hypothetical protein